MFTSPVRNLLAQFISLFKHFLGGEGDFWKRLFLAQFPCLFKLVFVSKESRVYLFFVSLVLHDFLLFRGDFDKSARFRLNICLGFVHISLERWFMCSGLR